MNILDKIDFLLKEGIKQKTIQSLDKEQIYSLYDLMSNKSEVIKENKKVAQSKNNSYICKKDLTEIISNKTKK